MDLILRGGISSEVVPGGLEVENPSTQPGRARHFRERAGNNRRGIARANRRREAMGRLGGLGRAAGGGL